MPTKAFFTKVEEIVMTEIVQKKAYQTPHLEVLGTAAQLTEVGQTRPGDDDRAGSVVPPPQQ